MSSIDNHLKAILDVFSNLDMVQDAISRLFKIYKEYDFYNINIYFVFAVVY